MAPDETPVSILLVDDQPAKLLALAAALEGLDIGIVTATSGEMALRRLLEQDFAAVLLDVNMPVMDGFETATLIRSRPRSLYLPILFITAERLSEDSRLQGYALGAVDYVLSPVLPLVLRAKVAVFADLFRLRRQSERLASEMHRKNEEIARQNLELEAFSYSVSHDLRTPLRALDGFSRILLTTHADRLDDEGRDCLQRIRAASQHMAQMVEDILSLSRISRSELQREEVDLSAMAVDILAGLQEAEPSRQVEPAIQPGLIALADPHLIRIALDNLLGNAWKFTGRTAGAWIAFTREERHGQPGFLVRDNGAGFDMAYAGKLFVAFQRLHSRQEFPGTGIGLATVMRVVHRHGGELQAEGRVGQGAAFWFSLAG